MVIESFQMPVRQTLLLRFGLVFLIGATGEAKSLPPKPVQPVIADGIRYSAEGSGRDQYVVAADLSSGSLLWKVKVFRSLTTPWKEIDVQIVFISDLKLVGDTLLVRDERSRCYSVNLITKRVKKQQCNGFFSLKALG
jgi:hypothetical protein